MTAHILLVEDAVKFARFIELELSSDGYQVSVAHDDMTGQSIFRILLDKSQAALLLSSAKRSMFLDAKVPEE